MTAVHVTCPKKGVFSLAALTSVHFVSVRVSVRFKLSADATDLPKVSLDLPTHNIAFYELKSSPVGWLYVTI